MNGLSALTTLAALILAPFGCAPALSDPGNLSGSAPMDASGRENDARRAAANADSGPMDCCVPTAADANSTDGISGLTATDLAGTWSGTTSQGQPISFVVDQVGLDSWRFGWQLPDCQSTSEGTFPPVPIAAGEVAKSLSAGPGGLSVTMTISFRSTESATGTMDFTLNQAPAGGCSGKGTATFTAARAPDRG